MFLYYVCFHHVTFYIFWLHFSFLFLQMELIEKNLDNALKILFKKSNKGSQKKLFDSQNVSLSIVHKKVPSKPKSIIVTLPHSLFSEGDRVCLITKDVHGQDYEKTNEHYKQLLKQSTTKCPAITVMSLRELTVCYMTFESRRKLKAAFDFFLADASIYHRLANKLGSQFTLRQMPVPVNLEARDIGAAVTGGLSNLRFAIVARGAVENAVVAKLEMGAQNVKQNVMAVVAKVLPVWPGGDKNIRHIQLRGPDGPSVPLFFSDSDFKEKISEEKTKDTFVDDISAAAEQMIRKKILPSKKRKPKRANKMKQLIKKKK